MVDDLEQRAINVIRGLAMDAPQRANSGHPGTAMALAPLAYVLWTRVMLHDPTRPDWPDRDRFILSAGHASILLYSLLYLSGYGLTLEDIRSFRQWGSRTPGHPEVHHTPGVEVTSGPLGQGFANGVGMGIAERMLRARFGPEVCDHHVFVICSDGDLQEGISHESASLAGHLGLGRLVYVYDSNHISIDGPTELAFTEDRVRRFEAYGWHVEDVGEAANDLDTLEGALRRGIEEAERPSLIVLRSHIGWPSPAHTDTKEAHGEPLGQEDVQATKEILGLPPEETFWVPDDVLTHWRKSCISKGQAEREAWERRLAAWDGDREAFDACLGGQGLPGWETKLPSWEPGESLATRQASGACLNAVLDVVPGLVAGGADLTGNTGTLIKDGRFGVQSADNPAGRQLYYGVREHGMGGVMNGMALHGGVLPVGGTFLVFSDYMRPSVRLASMSKAHVIYAFTHDSVGLGEDGPTHQPIEQIMSLRAVPGLRTIRPADANECAQAWVLAVDGTGPTALFLTRQKVPVLEGTAEGAVAKGAYVLVEAEGEPDIVLIGTGSEVHVCVEARRLLGERGIAARVVSMPSWELFAAQDDAYRTSVLPGGIKRLAVEAGTSLGWERYADASVSIDRFGASAPGTVALQNLGFTPENVVSRAQDLLREGTTSMKNWKGGP